MTGHIEGQVVKGKQPPSECPHGYYWRKTMGLDEFKLYAKKERKAASAAPHGEDEGPRMTANRVAEGVRRYMQNEDRFKRVMDAAALSAKALQNFSTWANIIAVAKAEKEKTLTTAVAKANAALRDAGLMLAPDGTVQRIPTA